jgi:predicted transcriptional regulator
MTPVKAVVDPEMSVYEAIDMLINNDISGAPVVDRDGRVVGILTEKDCLRVLSMSHLYNLTGGKVVDFMSEVKMSLSPDTDLLTVASKFLATNFTILPVLDGETLVGRVTRRDMLRAVQQMQFVRRKAMEREKDLRKHTERPSGIEAMQNFVAASNREQIATVFAKEHDKR